MLIYFSLYLFPMFSLSRVISSFLNLHHAGEHRYVVRSSWWLVFFLSLIFFLFFLFDLLGWIQAISLFVSFFLILLLLLPMHVSHYRYIYIYVLINYCTIFPFFLHYFSPYLCIFAPSSFKMRVLYQFQSPFKFKYICLRSENFISRLNFFCMKCCARRFNKKLWRAVVLYISC